MDIEFLKPKERNRVMDLVESVGIDISDWANFKGGINKAASNPKYCYEWSYEAHDKQLIILNLWYENLEIINNKIIQNLNLRETAQNAASSPQARRATKMDFSLQKAARLNWPVRVIICGGERRKKDATKSRADSRILDDEQWYIESYNAETGDCRLVRGVISTTFIDQFSIVGAEGKNETTTTVYERSSKIRNYVLERAGGFCELCGEEGFSTSSGSLYLETHHIEPLSEGGSDTINNVIALCPNHHRQAHFGINAIQLKKDFKGLLERVDNPTKKI
ncbi:HNH endonuclease [Aliivibrio fischeri]|uniref:HNH endonuclease n=1 Tax=Aliivibrio fischeri TaxID=668 RepID=UPI0012DA9F0C|nr:HNH endonuclease signature motif containing protein [Aliivibrio fischeri]MUK43735.1 HNH endonuclease [Aliivibrio fischeri]